MTIITIGGLGLDHDQLRFISLFPNPQYTGRIVLSWNLISWILAGDRIPSSFTNFITTPEFSGPFHISQDNYHTQITEYLLCKFYRWALFFPQQTSSNCYPLDAGPPSSFSFRTGALVNTFPLLFQLDWFFIYSENFVQNALYVGTLRDRCLIFWRLLLSGFRSVLVNTSDKASKLKIRFVSRDLVPIDRAACTIASRVNFFNSKKKTPSRWLRSLKFESITPKHSSFYMIVDDTLQSLLSLPRHSY